MPLKHRCWTERRRLGPALFLCLSTFLVPSWASDPPSSSGFPLVPLQGGNGPRPFSFIVYGDIQENHRRAHRSLVEHMLAEEASFVLNTGDISRDGGRGYRREFLPVVRDLVMGVPFFPAVGNHDVDWMSPRSRSHFSRFFRAIHRHLGRQEANAHLREPQDEKLWYSFRFRDALFIALDSNFFIHEGKYRKTHRLKPYRGHLREQLVWLRNQLAEASQDPTIRARFVFFHHSPIVSDETRPIPFFGWGGHPGHARMLVRQTLPRENSQAVRYLLDLFREHRVNAVFSGHEHYYERWQEVISERGEPIHVLNWVVTGLGGTRPRGRPRYETEKIEKLFEKGQLYREYLDRISTLNPDWTARLRHPYPNSEKPDGRFHNYVLVRLEGDRIQFQTRDSSGRIRDRGYLAPLKEVFPRSELRPAIRRKGNKKVK